jgi:hypothetical protein
VKYAVSIKAIRNTGFISPTTFEHAVNVIHAKNDKEAIEKAEKMLDKTFPDKHYMGKGVIVMEVK